MLAAMSRRSVVAERVPHLFEVPFRERRRYQTALGAQHTSSFGDRSVAVGHVVEHPVRDGGNTSGECARARADIEDARRVSLDDRGERGLDGAAIDRHPRVESRRVRVFGADKAGIVEHVGRILADPAAA